MATVVTDPGESSGSKRRRRRARERSAATAQAHNGHNGAPEEQNGGPRQAETAVVAVAEPAAPIIETQSTPLQGAPAPPQPDEFRDLLG